MKDFIFPFSTCEKPNKKGIAQPYSAMVNAVSILIIYIFYVKQKSGTPFC